MVFRGFKLVVAAVVVWIAVPVVVIPHLEASAPGSADLERRIDGHRAIERVYWEHRIWPKANPGPKPDFATLMPETELRAMAEDSLRLSAALRDFWGRPITTEDLQREVDRMIDGTTMPTMLEELFAAVGHDPALVAECLARPLLADRLARRLYASDPRIHGELEQRARREAEALVALPDMAATSGVFEQQQMIRYGVAASRRERMAEDGVEGAFFLDPVRWQRMVEELDRKLGRTPVGVVGPLRETTEGYSVSAVLERSEDRLRIATAVWRKQDFDSWWAENRSRFAPDADDAAAAVRLRPIGAKSLRGDSWADTDDLGAPDPRSYHTATWTGAAMVVWGGLASPGQHNTGRRYYPASDAWTHVALTGAPTARAYHSAVWTGTEVVIWGGLGGNLKNDGARWYASTNTWYAMESAAAPTARLLHSATWNGTSMSVFGGWNGSDFLGVGARWFGSNYWNVMSSTNAAGGRIGHAAVFCEDSNGPIVIWGGEDDGGVFGSGGEYDPLSNTWETIPTGPLAARTELSGVYMSKTRPGSPFQGQSRVVLWGGELNTGSPTATGAGYDPVANEWSTIATPTIDARQGHTAVVSGWTMIVWGGYSGATDYQTGGIYNPVNDDWETTITLGAPTARHAHTAVWQPESGTNDQAGTMIVWGGDDATGITDTGGRYTPPSDIVITASQDEFETVPGGTEAGVVSAILYSLNAWSGSVDLSCEPDYSIDCSFAQNPAFVSANGIKVVDIDFYTPAGAITTDYGIQISADHGEARSYPLTMKVQDFDVSCSQSSVTVAPGGTVDVPCSVTSEAGFDDPVSLACTLPYTSCDFSLTTVIPPPNGSANTILTIEPTYPSGTWSQTVRARSHAANRTFSIQVIVSDDLIFADGFESGDMTMWSVTNP